MTPRASKILSATIALFAFAAASAVQAGVVPSPIWQKVVMWLAVVANFVVTFFLPYVLGVAPPPGSTLQETVQKKEAP